MPRQFDQENNRLEYSRLLAPEEGYQLSFATGMTYSLDLEALLCVPISLGMLADLDVPTLNNPNVILEAIHRSRDKIAIFCNADGIKMPENIQPVFTLLENSVFPVHMEGNANFHPKLWLIRYSSTNAPDMIKVIILSRNLTFDRSMDIALEMKGYVENVENQKHKPLQDMLQFVANSCTSKEKRAEIRKLGKDIMKVPDFDMGDLYEGYKFIPIGLPIPGRRTVEEAIFQDANRLLVVSPFLSEGVIKKITENLQTAILISRIGSITPAIFQQFQKVYVPIDGMMNNDILEEEDYEPKRDLHAKVVFKDTGKENFLYLGSLNISENAFYHNIEFMAELKFKPGQASIQTVLDDFVPEKNSAFEELNFVESEMVQDEEEEHMSYFSDVIDALENAAVIKIENQFKIVIHAKNLEHPAEIAPMLQNKNYRIMKEEIVFDRVLLKELSEFYVIRRDHKTCIVKIPTTGIPIDERDNTVYNAYIENKTGFLAYLLFLLADDYAMAAMEFDEFKKQLNHVKKNQNKLFSPAIYERLLRKAATEPERFDDVIDVMERLDPDKVDDDLRKLITTFQLAAGKGGKRR